MEGAIMVMPDAAELVWGLLSMLIMLALAAVVVSVVLLATREVRKGKERDAVLARIDARLARLEQREDSRTDA